MEKLNEFLTVEEIKHYNYLLNHFTKSKTNSDYFTNLNVSDILKSEQNNIVSYWVVLGFYFSYDDNKRDRVIVGQLNYYMPHIYIYKDNPVKNIISISLKFINEYEIIWKKD